MLLLLYSTSSFLLFTLFDIIVEVTTKHEYYTFVLENDRWEQHLSLQFFSSQTLLFCCDFRVQLLLVCWITEQLWICSCLQVNVTCISFPLHQTSPAHNSHTAGTQKLTYNIYTKNFLIICTQTICTFLPRVLLKCYLHISLKQLTHYSHTSNVRTIYTDFSSILTGMIMTGAIKKGKKWRESIWKTWQKNRGWKGGMRAWRILLILSYLILLCSMFACFIWSYPIWPRITVPTLFWT